MTARIPLSLASVLQQPTQYLAKLWRILRTDGTELHFTDHSDAIIFEGDEYVPAGGMSATASQQRTGLREANKSFSGVVLDHNFIQKDDLRSGRYDGAEVREYLVDWRVPYVGAYLYMSYWILEVSWTGQRYEAEVAGLTTFLRQEKGDVFSRDCIWNLGENCANSKPGCKINTSLMWVEGAVTALNNKRNDFETNVTVNVKDVTGANTPITDDWFQFGWVIFNTGKNRVLPPAEVARSYAANGRLTLSFDLPFDIAIGDEFVASPGCDRQRQTCIDKFSNILNYRGHDFIPGTDAMLETPNAQN